MYLAIALYLPIISGCYQLYTINSDTSVDNAELDIEYDVASDDVDIEDFVEAIDSFCDSDIYVLPTTSCIRYVDISSGSILPDGLSWGNAFTDIDRAIESARIYLESSTDIIHCDVWVARGDYFVYDALPTDGIRVNEGILLLGGFIGSETLRDQRLPSVNETYINGANAFDANKRVFHVVSMYNNSILDGFTIKNGRATGDSWEEKHGGGVLIDNAVGVGVYNVYIMDNQAITGSGMYVGSASQVNIANSTFIYNSSTNNGGGLYSDNHANVIVRNSYFGNNSALDGGAMFGYRSATTIENCIFINNSVSGLGAGVAAYVGLIHIEHALFYQNNANEVGGALLARGGYDEYLTLNVANSIFWDNHPDEIYEELLVSSEYHYCDIMDGWIGENILDIDPLFIAASEANFQLDHESILIDAADTREPHSYDIIGCPCFDDPYKDNTGIGDPKYCDIGPFEHQI